MKQMKMFLAAVAAVSMAWVSAAATYNEVVYSPANAGDGTLRAAVGKATSTNDVVNITFSASMQDMTVQLAAEINVVGQVRIDGSYRGVAIDSQKNCRLFNVGTEGASLALDSLTLQNCSDQYGGAILVNAQTACEIRNCRFSYCLADNFGGAIYIESGAKCRIFGCTFVNNGSKGSTYGGGAISNDGDMLVVNSTFANNGALSTSEGGGAISQDWYASCSRIYGCTFYANNATSGSGSCGGAVYASDGVFDMVSCLADNNVAGSAKGNDFYVTTSNPTMIRTYCHAEYGFTPSASAMCGLNFTSAKLFGGTSITPRQIRVKGVLHDLYDVKDGADAAVKGNGLVYKASSEYERMRGHGKGTAEVTLTNLSPTSTYELLLADQIGVQRASGYGANLELLSEGITVGAVQRKDMSKPLRVTTTEDVDFAPMANGISLREAIANAIAGLGLSGSEYEITFDDKIFTGGKATFDFLRGIVLPNTQFVAQKLVIEAPGEDDKQVYFNGGNSASSGQGGDVDQGSFGFNLGAANTVTFRNLNFERFYATRGAAISSQNCNVELENCSFRGNRASSGGGAVFSNLGSLKARDCSFYQNKADNNGGALYLYRTESSLINVILSHNNDYYVGPNYENSKVTSYALYVSGTDSRCVIGNMSCYGNVGGGLGVNVGGSDSLTIVNSFFCDSVNSTTTHDLTLFGVGTFKAVNCLIGDAGTNVSLKNANGYACEYKVDPSRVYADNLSDRVARGVRHCDYRLKELLLGTGVETAYYSTAPWTGFGFWSEVHSTSRYLVGSTVSVWVETDIFGTNFEPSTSPYNTYSIGAVYGEPERLYMVSRFDEWGELPLGQGRLIGCGGGDPGIVELPSVCNGVNIVQLGPLLFNGNTLISKVKVPDLVDYIPYECFEGCTGLRQLILGRDIADYSYIDGVDGLDGLEYVEFSADNPSFTSFNGMIYDSTGTRLLWVPRGFPKENLQPGDFAPTLTEVGSAFTYLQKVKSITLPDSVTDIDNDAFGRSKVLATVNLGTKVSFIDTWAFDYAYSLKAINVAAGNADFKSVGGILYSKDGKTLRRVPAAIPALPATVFNGVTEIAGGAMSGCVLPQSLKIPDTVQTLGNYIMEGATGIESLEVGSGVTHVAASTFNDSETLKHVVFGNPAVEVADWTFSNDSALETVETVSPDPAQGFAGWCWVSDPATKWDGNGTAAFSWAGEDLQAYFAPCKTITFVSNGGSAVAPIKKVPGNIVWAPVDPVRPGYAFLGWYEDDALTTKYVFTTMPSADKTLYAKWSIVTYTITYNLNGGTNAAGNPSTYTVTSGRITLREPTRTGYVFNGWTPSNAIAANSTGNKTFTANWAPDVSDPTKPESYDPTSPYFVPPELYATKATEPFTGNVQYAGWVRNDDGSIKGSLSIKAAKPSKKTNTSKLTVTYTPFGGKKQAIKGLSALAGGNPTVAVPGIGTLTLANDSFDSSDCWIEVGQDYAKSKNKAVKAAAMQRIASKEGAYTFALALDGNPTGFSVTVNKKGKGKLSGVLPDGTKVSVSAQGVLGDDALAIPFTFAKKASFGLVFWVYDNGAVGISDLTKFKNAAGQYMTLAWSGISKTHELAPAAVHTATALDGAITLDFTVARGKWALPKKGPANPTGLKLAYKAKDGTVKGSLTVGRVKYTVAGVVVGNKMLGTAYKKGVGSFSVVAE